MEDTITESEMEEVENLFKSRPFTKTELIKKIGFSETKIDTILNFLEKEDKIVKLLIKNEHVYALKIKITKNNLVKLGLIK